MMVLYSWCSVNFFVSFFLVDHGGSVLLVFCKFLCFFFLVDHDGSVLLVFCEFLCFFFFS